MSPELSLRKPWPQTEDVGGTKVRVDDAFIQFHYDDVFRVAWLMLGDVSDAEDIAQQTFIVAMERSAEFRGNSTARGWLQGILVRLVMRRRRWYARWKRRLVNYAERHKSGCETTCRHHQQWQASIWAAVARLPPHQSAVIQLRFGSRLKLEAIADALSIPVGTVKSRLHHALQQLRQDPMVRDAREALQSQEFFSMETLDAEP